MCMKFNLLTSAGLLAGLCIVLPAPSLADIRGDVSECRSIEDSLRRLVCYDGIELEDDASDGSGTVAAGQGPKEIARFEGTGMRTTRPFSATGPFVVRAWSKGMPISVMVQSTASEWDLHALSMTGSGPEETFVPEGGEYVLEVMAFSGPWEIVVLDAE